MTHNANTSSTCPYTLDFIYIHEPRAEGYFKPNYRLTLILAMFHLITHLHNAVIVFHFIKILINAISPCEIIIIDFSARNIKFLNLTNFLPFIDERDVKNRTV